MEKQIKLFLEFLQNEKKLSDNTLQSYKRDLKQFLEYINEYKNLSKLFKKSRKKIIYYI